MTKSSGSGQVSHRVLRLAMGAALTGSLVIGQATVSAQTFSFGQVRIDGNQRVEDGTILSYAGISRGQSLSAAELNDAAQRIRASGLFSAVDVTPRGGTLVIEVAEKPTVNRISIEGNSAVKDAVLTPLIGTTSRRAYDEQQVQRDARALAKVYADKGRINAVVTPKIIRRDQNRVDVVFEVIENGVTEIERISFVGNRSFSDRRLRGVLQTKQAGLLRLLIQSDTFVADRIAFDKRVLTDFYRSRGYVDFDINSVDVTLSDKRDAYEIVFNVTEGQQFSIAKVDVTSDHLFAKPDAFRRAIKLRSGATYSPTKIEADIDRIEAMALRDGVNFLRVEPKITRNDRDLSLNVTYHLAQGPKVFIERIDIEGNTTTLDRVVRNQFRVVEGDPFSPRQIRQSAERIRALGYFGNADVNARQGSGEDRVVIDVDVEEQPTGNFSFGANYNPDTGAGLLANFRERNFLGRGQMLNFGLSTARRNRSFTFDFSEPQFLGRDVRAGFSASYRLTNNENALYDTARGSLSPSLAFPLNESTRLSTFYRFAYTDLTDVSASASQIIKDEGAEGALTSHSVGYRVSWDTLRSGSAEDDWRVRLEFGQELGRTSGDSTFVRTSAEAKAQTRIWREDVTLTATIEGGVLRFTDGNSRVTDRYFMGSSVMRGFQPGGVGPRDATTNDALGGNMYAVARLEAGFPIGLPEEYGITGGLFVDYGSLWDVGRDGANILYDGFTPRTIAGASLFWSTPIGPLRFNFTRPIDVQDKDETRSFDVTISTRF